MKKKILFIFFIFIFLIILIFFFKSKKIEVNETYSQQENQIEAENSQNNIDYQLITQNNQKDIQKFNQALDNGLDLKCNLLDLKTNQPQTILMKNKNLKITYNDKISKKTLIALKIDQDLYLYNSNQMSGLKIEKTILDNLPKLESLQYQEIVENNSEIYQINCYDQVVSENEFQLPTKINFLDFNEILLK